MSNDPGPTFFEAFTPDVCYQIRAAMERAYLNLCQRHDPDIGDNANTFGYDLYHFACFEIKKINESSNNTDGLTVLSTNPTFRFKVGEYVACCYRVVGSDDIWKAFPRNDEGAGAMVQLELFETLEPDIRLARNVVIAHMGNSEDGLKGVWICIPTEQKNGRIVKWGFVHPIMITGTAVEPIRTGHIKHAEEVIDEVAIGKKEISKDDVTD